MSIRFQRITPFLWLDDQAEEAANFYVSIFENSAITTTTRYGGEAAATIGRPAGSVMTVSFQLDGQEFTTLNGGPHFKLSESVSMVVNCRSQAEVDYYWGRLSEGGDESAQMCGWLKDRYGLSWQVVPELMTRLLTQPDPAKAETAMQALMHMKKIDVKVLEEATR